VLGERREVAAGREVTRVGDGVRGEARAAPQVQLLGEPLEELVRRKHELERESREDVADLAHLAVVAGPDQELHQPAPRRNRATSSVVEYPGTSATRTTRPPQPSTSSAPTISWRASSAPSTNTPGRRRRIRSSGASASNCTTQSTQASARR